MPSLLLCLDSIKGKKSVLTKETCITFMAGRKKKSEGRGQIKEILI